MNEMGFELIVNSYNFKELSFDIYNWWRKTCLSNPAECMYYKCYWH